MDCIGTWPHDLVSLLSASSVPVSSSDMDSSETSEEDRSELCRVCVIRGRMDGAPACALLSIKKS